MACHSQTPYLTCIFVWMKCFRYSQEHSMCVASVGACCEGCRAVEESWSGENQSIGKGRAWGWVCCECSAHSHPTLQDTVEHVMWMITPNIHPCQQPSHSVRLDSVLLTQISHTFSQQPPRLSKFFFSFCSSSLKLKQWAKQCFYSGL